MNIAFCDDDKFLLKQLFNVVKNLIDKYNQYNFSFKYYFYTDAIKFLQDYKSIIFDIAFLDIEMPEIDGLSIGDKIYECNNDVFIFYVTSYDAYLPESIKHRVYRFVRKGDKKELEDGIKRLFSDLVNLHSRYCFTFKNSSYNLPTNSIIFCESMRNKVIIHTKTKKYEQIISLKQMLNELPNNFCKCHSSFLVNVKKIREIHDNNLVLDDDIKIPLSRKYKFNVIEHIGSIF